MNVGGLDMDRRGEAFETHVREILGRSNRLASFELVPRSITLEANGVEEEIDLIVRVGKTILIGEVKCSIHPTEPMEVHNYFHSRLYPGADQAFRKAEFVKENFGAFLSKVGFEEIDEGNHRVVPVVVTNLSLGVGHSFNGVPVVDLFVLQKYIGDGVVEHNIYLDEHGNSIAQSRERLYTSEEEAERAIESYLKDPPQLRHYKSGLRLSPMPIQSVSSEDKPAYFIDLANNNSGAVPLPDGAQD